MCVVWYVVLCCLLVNVVRCSFLCVVCVYVLCVVLCCVSVRARGFHSRLSSLDETRKATWIPAEVENFDEVSLVESSQVKSSRVESSQVESSRLKSSQVSAT